MPASRGPATTRRCCGSAPRGAAPCWPRCSWRRARRSCWRATRWATASRATTTPIARTTPTSWLDWAQADEALTSFVCALSALRRRYPAFRHPRWFQGHPFHEAGHPYIPGGDIAWLRPDGLALSDEDWNDPWDRSFAYVIEVGEGRRPASERAMVLLHPGDSVLAFTLPEGAWRVAIDTATPEWGERRTVGRRYELAGPAICVLVQAMAASGDGAESV